jgi:hypothetical protein
LTTPLKAGAAPPDELHLSADLAYQQRTWRVQRVSWVILLGVLAAAALGVFGSGVLSTTTEGSKADELWIEYDRFVRRQAPSALILHLDRKQSTGEQVHVVLRGGYPRSMQVESVLPQPSGGGLTADGAFLKFDVNGHTGPLQIVFHFKLTALGPVRGEVGVQGGPTVKITHWVYP